MLRSKGECMLWRCLQALIQIAFVLAHHDAEVIVFLGDSQQLHHLDLWQTKAEFRAPMADNIAKNELLQEDGGEGGARCTPCLHWRVIACISFVSFSYASLSSSLINIRFTATWHTHMVSRSANRLHHSSPAHLRFRAITLCQQPRAHDTESSTSKDVSVVDDERLRVQTQSVLCNLLRRRLWHRCCCAPTCYPLCLSFCVLVLSLETKRRYAAFCW